MVSFSVRRFLSSNPKLLLVAAAILLILGIPLWFYDFFLYAIFRLLACFISAYYAYRIKRNSRWLFWAMIAIAFALNPNNLLGFLNPAFLAIDLLLALFFAWTAKQLKTNTFPPKCGNDYRIRHLLIAGCLSLTVGVCMMPWFRFLTSIDDVTVYDRITKFLVTPSYLIVNWLMPDGGVFLWPWKYLYCTMVFYGGIAWLALSLEALIRARKLR